MLAAKCLIAVRIKAAPRLLGPPISFHPSCSPILKYPETILSFWRAIVFQSTLASCSDQRAKSRSTGCFTGTGFDLLLLDCAALGEEILWPCSGSKLAKRFSDFSFWYSWNPGCSLFCEDCSFEEKAILWAYSIASWLPFWADLQAQNRAFNILEGESKSSLAYSSWDLLSSQRASCSKR